jgi:glycosyltransferase involved in cell wall biosynthesis
VQIPDLPQRLVAAESPPPGIAVVVCTYRRPRELERCLRSLRQQAFPPAEIVVADNAPSGPAARRVAEAAGARYVAVPVRGVSRARNAGARQCSGTLVAFIDDDMVAHPLWLQRLAAAFADPRVIAVTGPVMPEPLAQAPPATLVHELQRQPWGAAPFHVTRGCADWFERAHFGGLGDGNMAFRRAAFEEWPGFEERIGRGAPINGGEEHYAFFELIERGHRIAYAPEAIVFHPRKEESAEVKLRSIAETAAYSCFVAANHPRYAARVLRFLLQGMAGVRRPWRPAGQSSPGPRLSPARAAAAFLRGTLAYRRSRKPRAQEAAPARRSREATQQ